MEKIQFELHNKKVEVFYTDKTAPLVLYNAFEEDGAELYEACQNLNCPDFTLAVVSHLDWDNDLSPWTAEPMMKNEPPFGGKAGEYLTLLLDEVLPKIKAEYGIEPQTQILSGYSLAGLFAVYASFQTSAFSGIVSASGSMWYPNFWEFVQSHSVNDSVKKMYFSLGDKEPKVRHKLLSLVGERTEQIVAEMQSRNIQTVFEWNKGNHFQDSVGRSAKGIAWILSKS